MEQENLQQAALDEALVPIVDQVKIGSCNMRIEPLKTQKEPTYQLTMDILKQYSCYNAFLVTVDEFVEPPPHDALVSFIKQLGYKGALELVSEIYIDHMYQPWRTFLPIINRCLSGKSSSIDMPRQSRIQILWGMMYKKNVDYAELIWENFQYQIDSRQTRVRFLYLTYLALSKLVLSTNPKGGQRGKGKGLIERKEEADYGCTNRGEKKATTPRKKSSIIAVVDTTESEETKDDEVQPFIRRFPMSQETFSGSSSSSTSGLDDDIEDVSSDDEIKADENKVDAEVAKEQAGMELAK
ncbi:hypothetical protein Tco_0477165 [Tanacetum coccineum]